MKNNIYVLNQRQDETFDAAGKAMRDVFSVLADKKAKIIWSVPKHCSKYLKLLDLPYLVLFLLFCVKKATAYFIRSRRIIKNPSAEKVAVPEKVPDHLFYQ